ncbi:hypothetical protein HOE425_331753 [Hoeflea sp. EC-HK425]|nr:hypothetical protein HOE425_331753 [Hoeflea sp. EC-HK425]
MGRSEKHGMTMKRPPGVADAVRADGQAMAELNISFTHGP